MYRLAIEKLYEWKRSAKRKPLILKGARQVGKTWLMKEFGKQAYEKTVYINFDSNSRMTELFSSDLEIRRILMGLELYSDVRITPGNTLIIFDEIQEVPRALTSLKYFYENAPEYPIICLESPCIKAHRFPWERSIFSIYTRFLLRNFLWLWVRENMWI